ncbi:aspartate/ornithine carbamoyltransferase family protein [Streptomyces sp. 4N509B]|uniref:aspartate/ornithine carbamoyltransferase family protein n=1 Tax=Streptomyces sp. 4N509B TaxID=3457413 RepID=UPI003FCF3DAC
MYGLAGGSVLSVRELTRSQLLALFDLASELAIGRRRASQALSGVVVLTAFFEPSTRTRLSFESAAHRLGAAVISLPDGRVSSVHKGESLADTGVMLNSYADVVVLRHPSDASLDEIRATQLNIPLINGGNGCGEHPTQAMADWYALLRRRPELRDAGPRPEWRISLGLIGTPRRMRALRSFLLMGALHFPHVLRDVTVVSEDPHPLDAELETALGDASVPLVYTSDLRRHVTRFDVVYQNSLTLVGNTYEVLDAAFRVDGDTPLKPDALVMHPLARLEELGADLDRTPHNLYFGQAEGAVFVRQALLLAVAGRLDRARRSEHGEVG